MLTKRHTPCTFETTIAISVSSAVRAAAGSRMASAVRPSSGCPEGIVSVGRSRGSSSSRILPAQQSEFSERTSDPLPSCPSGCAMAARGSQTVITAPSCSEMRSRAVPSLNVRDDEQRLLAVQTEEMFLCTQGADGGADAEEIGVDGPRR